MYLSYVCYTMGAILRSGTRTGPRHYFSGLDMIALSIAALGQDLAPLLQWFGYDRPIHSGTRTGPHHYFSGLDMIALSIAALGQDLAITSVVWT